jgi:hypothetical protein
MSSNLRIPKVCQYCNNEFIAMKLTTKFCSLKCGQRNYKEKIRLEKLVAGQKEFKREKDKVRVIPQQNINIKPYLTIAEIQQNDLDLSYNRYKEYEYIEQTYDPPKEILAKLIKLEQEILNDMRELNSLIG